MEASVPFEAFYLFRGVPASETAVLEGVAQRKTYAAGDMIFHEGDRAEAMYVVERGIVEILASRADTVVATIRAGEPFGEVAFFDAGTRSASARAAEATQLVAFPYAGMREVLLARPTLAAAVYLNACLFMARRLRQTSSDYSWLSVYARS
jgi:CRP/FNR family transcriptional regulator